MAAPVFSYALRVVRVLLILICALLGAPIAIALGYPSWLGILLGLGFAGLLILMESYANRLSFRHFTHSVIGLLVGFGCAWLMTSVGALDIILLLEAGRTKGEQAEGVMELARIVVYVAFGFLGVALAVRSPEEEFSLLIPFVRMRRDNVLAQQVVTDPMTLADGRLLKIIESGFLGGDLMLTRSDLGKIHLLAASEIDWEQEQGKAALECMEKINQHPSARVRIAQAFQEGETDYREGELRCLSLARSLAAPLVTVDATAERLAMAEGVEVLSLAQLTLALRKELKIGDSVRVTLTKQGKDERQAVGYLNDGSMVVVNDAADLMGKQIAARVISLMPTSAGRMVFAEKVLDLQEPSLSTQK